MDQGQVGAGVFAVCLILSILVCVFRWRRKPREPDDPLELVLFWWDQHNRFTLRDLMASVIVLGRTGSGKSSSSARLIARAIVGYLKSGGLILAAKPEDVGAWRGIFKLAGREKDLILFAPGESWRLNCIDYLLKSGGTAKDVSRFLMTVGETLRSHDSDGQEDGKFWEKQNERVLYLAVTVLWQAYGKVSVPDLQRFINGAAETKAQIGTDEWKAGFHAETLRAAIERTVKGSMQEHDLQLALAFWLEEFPGMAERTRSSILVGVMGILHTYNAGYARMLLSTDTNVSPDDCLAGKTVLVNMCPAEWGDTGCLVNSAWKYLVQKRVLRREAKPGDSVCVIFADECQQFVNSMDAHYLAQCRSHLGAMVYITQSVSSLYGALGGETGKHLADALLANFGHAIVHVCDPITAEWASAKIGRSLQTFIGTSTAPAEDVWEDMFGPSKVTTSTSEHMEKILETRELMNGLRTGGKAAGFICDGIVIRSGEPFADGRSALQAAFSQK